MSIASSIPLTWDQAQRLFSRELNHGNYADLFLQYSVTTSVRLEDGIIRSASRSVSLGTGVRVVQGDSVGYAYCESFEPSDISDSLKHAAAIAGSGKPVIAKTSSVVEVGAFYPQQQPLSAVSDERRGKVVRDVLNGCKSREASVDEVQVSLIDTVDQISMFNSLGEMATDQRPMITLSVTAKVTADGRVWFGRGGIGARSGFELFDVCSPAEVGQEAVRQGEVMVRAGAAPAGRMPVVLGAGDSGVLIHESVGHPLEADFVRKGSSAYTGRLGEQVASSLCSVIDDGTIAGDRGSLGVDDELVPTQRTVLIEEGVLTRFMQDRISATQLGVPLTGNGRRESFRYPPMPRMRCTLLDSGTADPSDIVSSVKDGIYCVSFAGGQVNIASGDFVFVPQEAYRIENGALGEPVRNLTLIGNGPDVLTRLDMLGNDFKRSTGTWMCGKGQMVPVGIGMPTARISEMTVGGAGDA